MKFKIVFSIGLVLVIMITGLSLSESFDAVSNTSGAPSGKSGAPGEQNCTSCHAGTAVSEMDKISSDIPLAGYIPGSTYTFSASVDGTTNKFGFQISAKDQMNNHVGTLVLINTTNTQLVGSGKYITHKSAGTTGVNNSKTWSFQWIAPTAGTGEVTFYAAFNASNSNNSTGGDKIILSQYSVNEDPGVYIGLNDLPGLSIYPNPFADNLTVTNSNESIIEEVSIYTSSGQLVGSYKIEHLEKIEIKTEGLSKGIYFIKIDMNGSTSFTSKLIKL